MSWKEVELGKLLVESRIPAENPDPNRRIRVKLHVEGVEKRPLENEVEGATKQFIRKAGQFIYGKQNFHKGAFGIVPDELDGFETSADIPSFDVREDCLPEWIYYFFKSGNRYLELEKLARGIGSQRIHPKQIYDIKIPLPPKEKQWGLIQNIINTENKFNDFIGEQSHQLSLLKKLRQQILQDAVQGKLVPQDPNDEPASELLGRIKAEKEKLIREKKVKKKKSLPEIKPEEKPFEIPENWVWCRLGDVVLSMTNGIYKEDKFYKDEGIACLRMYNIKDGQINFNSLKRMILTEKELLTYGLEENDLLLNRVNSIELLGKAGLIKKLNEPMVFESKNIRVRVFNKDTLAGYLNYVIQLPFIKNQIYHSFKKVTGQASISQEKLNPLTIPLPPKKEQQRIVNRIEKLLKHCDELEQSIEQNQKYTQELLKVALKEALEPKIK